MFVRTRSGVVDKQQALLCVLSELVRGVVDANTQTIQFSGSNTTRSNVCVRTGTRVPVKNKQRLCRLYKEASELKDVALY